MARFAYIKEILDEDECVLALGEFHWIRIWAEYLLWIIGPLTAGLLWVLALRLLIGRRSSELAITNQRIIYKRGWIARTTEEIGLLRVEEVNLFQSVPGRIFGYGKLGISGTGGSRLLTHAIRQPLVFRKALSEARSALYSRIQ